MSKTKQQTPYADTAMTKLLQNRIDALKDLKPERKIAEELNFSQEDLAIIKNGEYQLPIDRLFQLSEVYQPGTRKPS